MVCPFRRTPITGEKTDSGSIAIQALIADECHPNTFVIVGLLSLIKDEDIFPELNEIYVELVVASFASFVDNLDPVVLEGAIWRSFPVIKCDDGDISLTIVIREEVSQSCFA